jgi:DNA-binding transcriptional regulator LsrR (DeoR family)
MFSRSGRESPEPGKQHAQIASATSDGLPPIRDGALLLTAAYLYYAEDRSQEEIARRIGVSRSTVSRLLAEARRTGIVRIEVTALPADGSLEQHLAAQLGIERVYAAPGIADENDPGPILSDVAGKALIDSGLTADDALLVSWGRATWSISHTELPSLPGVVVLPAVGGLNDDQPWFQTNEIARRLAASVHGRARLLHAPALPSEGLRRSLLADASIRSVISRWDDSTAILVGIGAWPKTRPHEAPTALPVGKAALRHAVGDVAGRLFDANGDPVHSGADSALLAVTRDQLTRIPKRIGIAAGIRKADAIIAAARSGLINVLVTDIVTASTLRTRNIPSRPARRPGSRP